MGASCRFTPALGLMLVVNPLCCLMQARLLVYWLVSAACAQVMERTLMRWLLSQAWRDPLLVPTAFIQAQLTQGRQAVQHLQER